MELSRRNFMELAGAGVLALGLGFPHVRLLPKHRSAAPGAAAGREQDHRRRSFGRHQVPDARLT